MNDTAIREMIEDAISGDWRLEPEYDRHGQWDGYRLVDPEAENDIVGGDLESLARQWRERCS